MGRELARIAGAQTGKAGTGDGKVSDWQIGPIPLKVVGDDNEVIETINVAGWRKGNWGLDFRVFDIGDYEDELWSGWMLTHLATGFSAFGILEPLNDAFLIADEIDEMADWSFDEPSGAKALSGIVPKITQRFGAKVTRKTSNSRGPTFYRGING
mgnify:FL=1